MTGALRVLVVHNRYQQAGGEDSVFENEVALLRSGGCNVYTLVVSNDNIQGAAAQVSAALRIIASPSGRAAMAAALARFKPDVVHVHNFFPQLSPAIFDACAAAGVPAVWTLHNFRVACANGLLFRNGRPCEDCVGRMPIPAIWHRCYRGSYAGSAAVAAMIGYHRAAGTWHGKVARFIALSKFARDLLVRAGLPRDRIAVKPNFVADPLTATDVKPAARRGAVFVGRLSPEKGVDVMLHAWQSLPHIPLTIVGDGPERARLEAMAPAHVRFVGFLNRTDVLAALSTAEALIVPSVWYEAFGLVVAEAMALRTPVIASRIGALASIVVDGENGLHFTPGDAEQLRMKVEQAFADPATLPRLGMGARSAWSEVMAPDRNLRLLLEIYREARSVPATARPRHVA